MKELEFLSFINSEYTRAAKVFPNFLSRYWKGNTGLCYTLLVSGEVKMLDFHIVSFCFYFFWTDCYSLQK